MRGIFGAAVEFISIEMNFLNDGCQCYSLIIRNLDKSLEFMLSKRPDLQPNPGFMQQLHYLDKRLQHIRKGTGIRIGQCQK